MSPSSRLHSFISFLGRTKWTSFRMGGPLDLTFVAVSEEDCPCSDNDDFGCKSLPECSYSIKENHLCEADQKLPDGNENFNVNNCAAFYDVFRYKEGKNYIFNVQILDYK